MVTEYAEGELFQILEDDGSLPEGQVHQIRSEAVTLMQYQNGIKFQLLYTILMHFIT